MYRLIDPFHGALWITAASSSPVGTGPLIFDDEREAYTYLRRLAASEENLTSLRYFLNDSGLALESRPLGDHALLQLLAARIASGQWLLVRESEPERRFTAGGRKPNTKPDQPPPPPPPEPAPTPAEKTWIKFEIVDDESGKPVPGVTLRVRLPDGQERSGTSNAAGLIEFTEIQPGACDILKMIDSHTLEVVSVQ